MRLTSGIEQLIKRPVKRYFGRGLEKEFKSAIPLHSGDSFLLSTLGKIISSPGIAEKAFGEGEVFLIKGGLFLSGVNVGPSADEGIGAQWKGDAGQHHFNPSAGLRKPRLEPCAIHMPHGFYSPLYLNPNSPFTLRRDKGNLFLYLRDLRLFPVQFEKRPGYYSRNTSTGVPMHHIGPHRL